MTAAETAPPSSKVAKLKIAIDNAAPEEEDNREVVPSPGAPLAVARHVLKDKTKDGHLLLRRWNGDFYEYAGPHYAILPTESLRKWLYERLEDTVYLKESKKEGEEPERLCWSPNKGKIDQLLDAMAVPTLIHQDFRPPTWLSSGVPGTGFAACQNGLVNIDDMKLYRATPDLFSTTFIPFDYIADAAPPPAWLTFLHSLWPEGVVTETGQFAEVNLIQEWFGYVISGATNLQKGLLLYGPKRSGKGTISWALSELLGGDIPGPSMASLGGNFGLARLLGKPLAIVGDARLPRDNHTTVIERLLNIIGEDIVEIDIKHRDQVNTRMGVRFMVLSNELPRFGDASGAIATRFAILHTEESFLGREDVHLKDKLRAELPAILKWSLVGLARLRARGYLVEPDSSAEHREKLADLVSPVSQFVREECTEGPTLWAENDALYQAWSAWCNQNNLGTTSKPRFLADLRSAFPRIRETRPHGMKRGQLGLSCNAVTQAIGSALGRRR